MQLFLNRLAELKSLQPSIIDTYQGWITEGATQSDTHGVADVLQVIDGQWNWQHPRNRGYQLYSPSFCRGVAFRAYKAFSINDATSMTADPPPQLPWVDIPPLPSYFDKDIS